MNNIFCMQANFSSLENLFRSEGDIKREIMNNYTAELREVIEAKTLITETPEFGMLTYRAEIAILSRQEYIDLKNGVERQTNRALFKMNNHLINKENLQRKLSAKYEAWTNNCVANDYAFAVAQGIEIALNIIDELED